MKCLLFTATILIGTAHAFLSAFDPEACVTSPATPITRVVNATDAQLIDSPNLNYDDPDAATYPPNTVCQWEVFRDAPAPELSLSFFYFYLEYVTDCYRDRIEVYEGADDTAPLIATVCGGVGTTLTPDPIVTTNLRLFIRFISDDNNIERPGFSARVGGLVENLACDGLGPPIYTDNNPGIIQTLGYPEGYDSNELCEWAFQGIRGQVIEVEFLDFESENDCSNDVLTVHSGLNEFGTQFAKFYGNNLPARFVTSGNQLYMRFESSTLQNFPGFRATYRFIDP